MIQKTNLCKPLKKVSRQAPRRGQALIEMALVVIVLLFLTLGLIQYGLIANARVTMANLAREGARYAAVHGTEVTADADTRDRVKAIASNTNLRDITDANILIASPNTPRRGGDLITVTITYDMRRKFIVPASFPGLGSFGSLTQTGATMVIEGQSN